MNPLWWLALPLVVFLTLAAGQTVYRLLINVERWWAMPLYMAAVTLIVGGFIAALGVIVFNALGAP